MKETYVQPDVQVMILAIEHNIMSNGEDLISRSYGSEEGENEGSFWD